MVTPKNKTAVCAHCGAAGPILCRRCQASGHDGVTMFGCAACIRHWNDLEARIAAACGRPAQIIRMDADASA